MKDYITEFGISPENLEKTGMKETDVNRFIGEHLEWRKERGDGPTELRVNNVLIVKIDAGGSSGSAKKKKK